MSDLSRISGKLLDHFIRNQAASTSTTETMRQYGVVRRQKDCEGDGPLDTKKAKAFIAIRLKGLQERYKKIGRDRVAELVAAFVSGYTGVEQAVEYAKKAAGPEPREQTPVAFRTVSVKSLKAKAS